jgi:tetratricopeptide (TPR) repeat protein
VLASEALAAAEAGYTDEGLRLAEDLLADYAFDATIWNIKGLIHGLRGEKEIEVDCFEKATKFAPSNSVLRGNYGVALHQVKKHAEAVEIMRDALARDRTLTYLHSWLAEAFFALNDLGEMQKEIEQWHIHNQQKAVQSPEDAAVWQELAVTATRLGKYDEAEGALERVRDLQKDRNLLAGPAHG